MKKIFILPVLILFSAGCGENKEGKKTIQPMGSIILWDKDINPFRDAIDVTTNKSFQLLMEHNQRFRYDIKAGKYALECIWKNKTDIYPLEVKSDGREEITLEHNNKKGTLSITIKLTDKQWEMEEKGKNYHHKYSSKDTPALEVFFMEKYLLKGTKK